MYVSRLGGGEGELGKIILLSTRGVKNDTCVAILFINEVYKQENSKTDDNILEKISGDFTW